MRRDGHQSRAGLLRLPDGLPHPDAHPLGGIIRRQHDAVPRFRVAADRHRLGSDGGMIQAFHGGIKAIGVHMKNDSAQHASPLRKQ